MELNQFASNHVELEVLTPGKDVEYFNLLSRAFREID